MRASTGTSGISMSVSTLARLGSAWPACTVECLVQAQGYVGVFGRIGTRLFQSDLVKGQLLGALAGDVLEADSVVVQVL